MRLEEEAFQAEFLTMPRTEPLEPSCPDRDILLTSHQPSQMKSLIRAIQVTTRHLFNRKE
jgi:hypothetical protein